MNDNDLKVCPMPWVHFEVMHDSNVYPCCPDYCKNFSFGNLQEQSFDEIWNGEKANFFRNEMLSGNYLLCNLDNCNCYFYESIRDIKQKYYDENGKVKFPEFIRLSDSKECNVACITCRDKIYNDGHKFEFEKEFITENIKQIKYIHISGGGDAFGSNYHRNLMKKIAQENDTAKFGIFSNGILMTREMCRNLGILNRIYLVSISLPGATKETYDKIVKFGNYDKVIDNVKWISQDDTIGLKTLNLVIHKLNYKEIPDFINLCKKYNFNSRITHYRYWGTKYGQNYDDVAIWKPDNPEHQEFLKVLDNDIVKQNKDYFDNLLADFIPES